MRMHARRDPFLDESEDPIMDLTLAFRAQRISIVETFVHEMFAFCHSHACLVSILLHLPLPADLLSTECPA